MYQHYVAQFLQQACCVCDIVSFSNVLCNLISDIKVFKLYLYSVICDVYFIMQVICDWMSKSAYVRRSK